MNLNNYKSFEYNPCKYEDRCIIGCDPMESEFWGVYGRNGNGLAEWVGDCTSELSASSFVKLLNQAKSGE